MRYVVIANHALLLLLGLATGLVKVFGLEADVEIFANLGFSYTATVLFGVVQVIAALMLLTSRSIGWGAIILGVSFVIATAGLFVSGMVSFGVASLLFIAMAAFAHRQNWFMQRHVVGR